MSIYHTNIGGFPLKHTKPQRIAAIIGIIIIVALYLTALICSLIEHPLAKSILYSALFSTIVIPALIHLFCWITSLLRRGMTPEDPSPEPASKGKLSQHLPK